MKVKRFLAQDMRHAIARIREEMGEDAVILSNRSLDGGVEVVAASLSEPVQSPLSDALEKSPLEKAAGKSSNSAAGTRSAAALDFSRLQREALHDASTPYLKTVKDQQIRTGFASPQPTLVPTAAEERLARSVKTSKQQSDNEQPRLQQEAPVEESREMNKMRSELNGIRRLLEQRLNGMAWDQFSRRSPVQATVWERLNAMGVPASLSKTLLESVKPEHTAAEAWRFAIASLSRAVPVAGTDLAADGGTFALVGPTGVGKTTTIGKLATRYVLEHGSDSVALVTTDSFRVAAHEQLRTFGRILGVTVRVVDDGHSLRQILDSLHHKSLILIDTAGLHPSDPGQQAQLDTLNSCRDVYKLLVLACTSQAGVLANACKTYASAGVSGCILSKLDEAGTMGEALALVIDRHFPVVYETHGQNIPDDISVAQSHKLVSKAVALSIHSDEEKERLMYEFGNAYDGNDTAESSSYYSDTVQASRNGLGVSR